MHHILRLIYDFPPPWDGLGAGPYYLTKAQMALGNAVTVVSRKAQDVHALEEHGLTIFRCFSRIPIVGQFWISNPKRFLQCIRFISEHRVDIIHSHMVLDLAEAHIQALRALDANIAGVFNVGSGSGHTVQQLLAMCEKVTGKKIPMDIHNRRDGDPAELVADITKITTTLGWTPKHSLENIVRDAWEWELKKS